MTDLVRSAQEAIRTAEVQLRALIETALSQQRYSDIARLAPIAEGLLNLSEFSVDGNDPRDENHEAGSRDFETHKEAASRVLIATASTEEHLYPRFERQGDRLAKIAWSKKDRREYEHRAPLDLILRIAELFERDTKRGKPFLMDDLMPFKDLSGDQIPSYQAYLALAWFRSLSLIEARGKDGYALAVDDLPGRVEREWKQLRDTLQH